MNLADATILDELTGHRLRSPPESEALVGLSPESPHADVVERAASHAAAPMPKRAGRYEIVSRIGGGGMAQVYLARAGSSIRKGSAFERIVAVKVLHPHLTADSTFVEMFLQEARVAAVARHANIVSILDVGTEDSMLYSVMDYVEGDTLAAVQSTAATLGRGVPLPITLRIILDALAGLHAAHELRDDNGLDLKLVHRDVTPQNILIGIDGTARLTDFGIARARGRATETRLGMLKGKLAYMPPEQLEAASLDRRADLFAMGVTLWETVALRRLYPGRTTYELARRNARAPYRPLHEIYRGIPPALDAICARALAHDPAERYASAEAFADDIEAHFGRSLASPREVGTFIAAVAREKLSREREALRSASFRTTSPQPEPSRAPVKILPAEMRPEFVKEAEPSAPKLSRFGLGSAADSSMIEPIPLLPRRPRAIVLVPKRAQEETKAEPPVEVGLSLAAPVARGSISRRRQQRREVFNGIAVLIAVTFGIIAAIAAVR